MLSNQQISKIEEFISDKHQCAIFHVINDNYITFHSESSDVIEDICLGITKLNYVVVERHETEVTFKEI